MPVKPILLLGNPLLRKSCEAVKRNEISKRSSVIADLHDTLADFRMRHGFGRGIAAPQIGVSKQIVYIDFEYSGALINPRIVKKSRRKFQLWDDCFSFPDLLVKVERHYSISVDFVNEAGKNATLNCSGALSELLQHEIDHVHGVLTVDRAVDSKHIVLRSEYEKMRSENSHLL